LLLTPGGVLEVVASGIGPTALRLLEMTDTTIIFTRGCDRVRVLLDGVEYTYGLLPDRVAIRVVPTAVVGATPARPEPRGPEPMWDRELDGFL
jgi:hypothetical protein